MFRGILLNLKYIMKATNQDHNDKLFNGKIVM